ncbi:TRAM, LAG1 and CLN8 (TLC) lipid-sensing domain containing protein, putative isoform 3 [Theobroma cacao]|uniref:TRAM, LAG1 and CLN8 (TLC) lipid-sensing domain containing protein, putative isoform 3 n=1 Tax=Theobroma cacao TaxID=3641 RepID=A0A061GZ21_THECC|nr:TRAM, LAG1 and CLN8 (TLC) lipid-sensing domain containing protein, putative isoform 3 [Theobroma cacao]
MVDLPSFPPAFTPIVLRLSSSKEFQWLASCSFSIITCKLVYKITGFISHFCFKGYRKLSNEKKVEWNNRGFSTFHALIAALASLYLLFVSDLFHEDSSDELIVNRTSIISNTILGFSIGYFLSDLAMIFWHFPALGGLEYIARIFLFIYFFAHMLNHFDQVKKIFPLGFYSLLTVPAMLALMNVAWFWKIIKGLIKTVSKARHSE